MQQDDTPSPRPRRSFTGALAGLYGTLGPRRRRHLLLCLAAMLAGALAELLTIGAVLPFLALVSDPARAASLPGFTLFLSLSGADPGDDLVVTATVLLVAATILAALARLLILWTTQRFVAALGHDIGTTIFSRMLRQPYGFYVARNPSEILSSVEKVQQLVFGVLMPLLQGVIASVIAVAIVVLLFVIDPATAALAAGAVGTVYAVVTMAARRRLARNAALLSRISTARMKAVQEGLGGIRDILLGHSQHIFEEGFRRLDRQYRRTQALNIFIGSAPRYLVEAAGIILIGLLAVYMSGRPGGIVAAIPVLGALALGSQRLLPLLQQAYLGWSYFAGSLGLVGDLLDLMEAPVVTTAPRRASDPVEPFTTDIVFDRVSLHYPGREAALSGIDLRIAKGERIGLVGTTGSGKSSFLDLLMALLEPSEGEIRIDGSPLGDDSRGNWQAQIAHVPQAVYLADNSIAANIAFAEPEEEIDHDRVREAARQAQLDDFILGLPAGYATFIGERGVRLSGGQRQRIAIARALYKRASVLILDEATGALDRKTEQAIMDAIAALGREITVLVVAHRISALAGCDRIVRLEGGRIAASGRYDELIGETA